MAVKPPRKAKIHMVNVQRLVTRAEREMLLVMDPNTQGSDAYSPEFKIQVLRLLEATRTLVTPPKR